MGNDQRIEHLEADKLLADLYDCCDEPMQVEEGKFAYPILNSLKLEEPYRLDEQVASGGEKTILKAFDHQTDRYIAYAQAKNESTDEDRERFLREARIAAHLEHPNIMPVHDIGLDKDGAPFFTMELISGDDLWEILSKLRDNDESYRRLYPLEVLLDILLKVCDAVEYAHSRQILHLDLKPANIQVGPFGEVLLCDWGLAKIIKKSESETINRKLEILDADLLNDNTLDGTLKGTPGYMAPEQFATSSKSPSCDIYALGAVLYSILTWQKPIESNTIEKMVQEICRGLIKAPQERAPERIIPDGLNAVVLKAMELKPEDRYMSVSAFRHEVQNFRRGFATGAEEASFFKQLSLFYRRNSLPCQILIGSLMLISLLIMGSISELRNKEQAAEQARQVAEVERMKAIENLLAYEREAKVNQQMQREMAQTLQELKQRYLSKTINSGSFEDILIKFSKNAENQIQFNAVMALLNSVLKQDPDNKKAWLEKGYLHFVMQQFSQSPECYQRAEHDNKELLNLAQKYAQLKEDHKLLEPEKLKSLFKSINNRRRLQVLMLRYDGQMNASISSHAVNVKILTDLMNPHCKQIHFDFREDESGNKLSLADSSGLKLLNAKFRGNPYNSILQNLHLAVLNLSGTDIADCREIEGLNLRELDISDTKIVDIRALQKMHKLKRLIISSGAQIKGLNELKKRGVIIESH